MNASINSLMCCAPFGFTNRTFCKLFDSEDKSELAKAQSLLQGDDVCKQSFRNLPFATTLHAEIDAKHSQLCAFDGIRRTVTVLESDLKKPPLVNFDTSKSAEVLAASLRKMSEGLASIQLSNRGQ